MEALWAVRALLEYQQSGVEPIPSGVLGRGNTEFVVTQRPEDAY